MENLHWFHFCQLRYEFTEGKGGKKKSGSYFFLFSILMDSITSNETFVCDLYLNNLNILEHLNKFLLSGFHSSEIFFNSFSVHYCIYSKYSCIPKKFNNLWFRTLHKKRDYKYDQRGQKIG